MHSFIAKLISYADDYEDPYPLIVSKFLRELDAAGRRELNEWLHATTHHLLTEALAEANRNARSIEKRRRKAHAFAADADAVESGDLDIETFRVTYVVGPENRRRKVGEMTAADHEFVAKGYRARSRTAEMLAAFHVAVAKRIPEGQTTADVMSESDYIRLRASIVGHGDDQAA